ncbi:hypothetical protein GGI12_002322 [Dipsacomyces acuminosporus]|nr:hypothetical protein GGI12_002322 [Dipsacomyces acuminosporus]
MVLSSVPWLSYLEQLNSFVAQAGVTKVQVPWLEYLSQLCDLTKQIEYAKLLATGAGAYAAYKVIYALWLSPLRNIPGPFLARITGKRAEYFGLTGAQGHKAIADYEKYGDIYVFQPNSIVICNPADIRTVLGSSSFTKTEVFRKMEYDGISPLVATVDPKLARVKKRQVGPYLSTSYLVKMEKAILTHGVLAIKGKWDGLLDAATNGQVEVNYQKTFLNATFDTMGSVAFGKEFGSLRDNDQRISKWLEAGLAYLGLRLLFPFLAVFPFSLALAPLERLNEEYRNYGAESIATRRELLARLEKDGHMGEKPADLLQGLLEAVDPETKARMSDMEIVVETTSLIGAGSETSANTLTWTIHLFMLYPECYKRAMEEVRSVFDKDHVITFSEAKERLPYLESCIYESLRLCPAAGALTPRVVPKQGVVLSGHFIPGGTEINACIHGANWNKRYWKEPYLFDPTRFLDNDEAKRNLFSFGYGVRLCPGKQLALFEILIILANLLKDYDFRLPEDYTVCGPSILNEHGYPKIMDTKIVVTSSPANIERDCRIVISRRQ